MIYELEGIKTVSSSYIVELLAYFSEDVPLVCFKTVNANVLENISTKRHKSLNS